MAKKTPEELKEAKARLVKLGKDMEVMVDKDPAFKHLLERLDKVEASAKEDIIKADSWEDFLQKKAKHEGLSALRREVDAIIARSKNAERTLKS